MVPDPLALSHSISLLMTGAELETFTVGVRLFFTYRELGTGQGFFVFFFFLIKMFLKENKP